VDVTAIYHFCLEIISRKTKRSAISAAAYRSGEKLSAVEKASYRAGEQLQDKDIQKTFDYSYRKDVVHKEILLPENAPKEYLNRETLWNAIEESEKRKDARTAREINVALPCELDLQEQIALLREFAIENFVNEGMIADINIHDDGGGNPHAHIMLTTRYVSEEGFGKKNFAWNDVRYLLKWRKSWADINNCFFEEKGLDVRIDHRSYKEQGIDREPTIHLGHEAWALEKKGVRTRKGDYNREVERRNRERAKGGESGDNTPVIEARVRKEEHTPKRTADGANNPQKEHIAPEKVQDRGEARMQKSLTTTSSGGMNKPYKGIHQQRLKAWFRKHLLPATLKRASLLHAIFAHIHLSLILNIRSNLLFISPDRIDVISPRPKMPSALLLLVLRVFIKYHKRTLAL
jgi:hypothetical protein